MTPTGLLVRSLEQPSGDLLDLEIVERKGVGHPDTICDGVAEELSLTLSRHYLAACGQILHHNVDKVLLAGGASSPEFGGGAISEPMQLFLAGRAVASFDGNVFPIAAMAEEAAGRWLAAHLPAIDRERHVKVHNLVRPGSADLIDLFARQPGRKRLCNDTSCGVGYAPLSRLETIVYAVEKELAAAGLGSYPAIGSDIKVMGIRRNAQFHLTIACALVSGFVGSLADYLDTKQIIAGIGREAARACGAGEVSVAVNTADDIDAGSIYLTVTGTSAEAGDDGEAGRGNRINGLITPCRPMTIESVSGKNPVTHVGKLYSLAASLIAQRLVDDLPEIAEAHCLMVSQIGRALDEPQAIELAVRSRGDPRHLEGEIAAIIENELSRLDCLAAELVSGNLAVGRWPLRQTGARR